MSAYTQFTRTALRLAGAVWLAAGLAGCGVAVIDSHPLGVTIPQAAQVAAQVVADVELSLAHHRAYHGLNFTAGAESRPAAFHGTLYQAHQRWVEGKVRRLPDTSTTQ